MTVLEALTQAITRHGSRSAFCRAHGLSTSYLADVLAGKRAPGPKILDALGWQKVEQYQPKGGTK